MLDGSLGADAPLLILPANAGAVRLFLAVETQWTFAGQMGVAMGLDYRAVEAAMNMMRVPARARPDLFARLRAIERAAGAALRARAKRRGG